MKQYEYYCALNINDICCVVDLFNRINKGVIQLTFEQTRDYLRSYKNMKNRVEYLDNVLIGVHSINYGEVHGSSGEHKTNNDFILMKDKYEEQMSEIRNNIEELENIQYRDVLFYRYVCCLNFYEVADVMQCSISHIKELSHNAIEELSNII